jgi:hypothetical protein
MNITGEVPGSEKRYYVQLRRKKQLPTAPWFTLFQVSDLSVIAKEMSSRGLDHRREYRVVEEFTIYSTLEVRPPRGEWVIEAE